MRTRIVFQVAIIWRGIDQIVNDHRGSVTIRPKVQTSIFPWLTKIKVELFVHCHIGT